MKVYKNPRKSIVEFVDDAGKSALRYRGHDRKLHYVASSEDPEGGGGGMTETTWQELKDLRDNSQLTPGSLYRITDYQCTTTQENTQSAGHQFDIVLLALSEDKLAEEGWAMMNESNIYDVTFSDGVTKKCYVYETDEGIIYYIVEKDTLLGATTREVIIMKDMTARCDNVDSTELTTENLPYNYFFKSNLSAWKLWYCLDNDTARFAWADDSVDEDSPASIEVGGEVFERSEADDASKEKFKYAWINGKDILYTQNTTPSQGDNAYINVNGTGRPTIVEQYNAAHEGTNLPNGRGVIYRLIDEWNNDVGYDFKNIQYVRPMTDGEYDDSTGTDTWVFTFSVYDVETQQYVDASIISGSRDENYMNYCWNNIISAFVSNQDNTGIFLPNNVFCQKMSLGDDLFAAIGDCYADGRSANNTIASSTMGIVLRRCDSNVISASGDLTIVGCYQQVIFDKDSTIILNGKAVLVET